VTHGGEESPGAAELATAVRGPRAWPDLAILVLLVLGCIALVHGPRLQHNFAQRHWEDSRFFRHTRAEIHSLADCFTKRSVWPGLYRPLTTNCYYHVGLRLFGNDVRPYHAVNVVMVVLNAVLVFAIASWLLPRGWAMVPPLLFVSRLAPIQVVLYTAEFQALLATTFSLLALLWACESSGLDRRGGGWVSAVFVALALFSKESSVVVPAILVAHSLVVGRPGSLRRCVAPWAVAGAWGLLFVLVLRGISDFAPTGFDYDISWRIVFRLATYLFAFSNLLVAPATHPAMTPLVSAVGHTAPAALVTVALACVGLAVLARAARKPGPSSEARVAAFGILWFFAASAPFVVLADRLFMRYTYFPLVGLCLAVTAGGLAVGRVGRAALEQQSSVAHSRADGRAP
jgi:hypothetical protein